MDMADLKRDSVTRDTPIGVCHVTSHGMSVIKSQDVTSRHNVTSAEVSPNTTVPLAAHLDLKSRYREERHGRLRAEAERDALKTTLASVLQGMKDGEK